MSNIFNTNTTVTFSMPPSKVQLNAVHEKILYPVNVNSVAALSGENMAPYGQGSYAPGDLVTIKSTGNDFPERINDEKWSCSSSDISIPNDVKTSFTFTMPDKPVSFDITGIRTLKFEILNNYYSKDIPNSIYWYDPISEPGKIVICQVGKFLPERTTFDRWEVISGDATGPDGTPFHPDDYDNKYLLVVTRGTDVVMNCKLKEAPYRLTVTSSNAPVDPNISKQQSGTGWYCEGEPVTVIAGSPLPTQGKFKEWWTNPSDSGVEYVNKTLASTQIKSMPPRDVTIWAMWNPKI